MKHSLTLTLAAALTLAGCATQQAAPQWPVDSLYDAPPPPPESEVDEYGQYRFTDSNLYRGNKPGRRGDHVVVRVSHSVSGAGNANTSVGHTSSAQAGLTAFFGLETLVPEISGWTPSATIGADDTNTFDGAGATNRTGTLSTVVTAKVLDVQANGYLVIGARQQVKINNEIDILSLYGVVDPRLIGSDNSISSTNIADLRMDYSGMGVVAGKQAPGWLTRVLDVVRPL